MFIVKRVYFLSVLTISLLPLSFSDGTSASLRPLGPLWPGLYKVTLTIQDQQGMACPEPQHLELHVCTCTEGVTCGTGSLMSALKDTKTTFGKLAIGVLFLGILMLCECDLLSESELKHSDKEQ